MRRSLALATESTSGSDTTSVAQDVAPVHETGDAVLPCVARSEAPW